MVSDGSFRWRIGLDPLHRVVEETRREGLPYDTGRERVRARVVGLLQRQAEARRAESPGDAWLRRMGEGPPGDRLPRRGLAGAHPGGAGALRCSATRTSLAAAADGLLTDGEQALLLRHEAGPRPRRRPGGRPPTRC